MFSFENLSSHYILINMAKRRVPFTEPFMIGKYFNFILFNSQQYFATTLNVNVVTSKVLRMKNIIIDMKN